MRSADAGISGSAWFCGSKRFKRLSGSGEAFLDAAVLVSRRTGDAAVRIHAEGDHPAIHVPTRCKQMR
jgi:hypothetical protein